MYSVRTIEFPCVFVKFWHWILFYYINTELVFISLSNPQFQSS